jgi:oxygen-independent coproporphyrinogen III oxidase
MSATINAPLLEELLRGSPFLAYSYAYPHKTAYRPLSPAIPLANPWQNQDRRSLFLYLHVPFCEFRCGFCNLFTLAQPSEQLPAQYLRALRRQAEAVREEIGEMNFARLAIGGGTPTFFSVAELRELLEITTSVLKVNLGQIPFSLEASPATITAEKLALARDYGVTRLSLGIQSFSEQDSRAMGRPQRRNEVLTALELLRAANFPVLNLDLIYGGDEQTMESWLASVTEAINHQPQELYLYPLYVRPLTGLYRRGQSWDDWRLELYREARQLLLSRGYEQVSLRMFRSPAAAWETGPVYCCQADGMIGLGCGARSYTQQLHYSREYAVSSRATEGILWDFIRREKDDFRRIDFGIRLDDDEQRRRHLILSLLPAEGMNRASYFARFQTDALSDFPQLAEFEAYDFAEITPEVIRLTPRGLEWSDAIGPWLYSPRVRTLSEEYAWR